MQREHQQNPKIEAKQIQKSKRDWGKGGGEERNFSQGLSIESGVFTILLWCFKVFQNTILNSMLTAKKNSLKCYFDVS